MLRTMPLSKRKQKYILNAADSRSSTEIAGELGIPLEAVERVLGSSKADTGRARAPGSRRWPWDALPFTVFLGLILAAPLACSNAVLDHAMLPKKAVIECGSLGLLAVWLLAAWWRGSGKIISSALFLPAGIFLAWAGLRIPFSGNRYEAILIWSLWAASALIFATALQLLSTRVRVAKTITIAALSGGLLSLLGLAQYLLEFSAIRQGNIPALTFANKNFAAQFLVLTLPFIVVVLFTANRRATIWTAAAALATVTACLFYTFTRAAWVAVGAQTLFIAVVFLFEWRRFGFSRRSILERAPAIGASLLLAIALINLTPNGWSWRLGEVEETVKGIIAPVVGDEAPVDDLAVRRQRRQSTIQVRYKLWGNAFEMIRTRPLAGAGLANFKVLYPLINAHTKIDDRVLLTRSPDRAHNDIFEITADLGLIALGIMIWGGLTLVLLLRSVFAPSVPRESRIAAYGLIGSVGGYFVVANFSFPSFLPIPPFLLAVSLAGLCALSRLSPGIEEPDGSSRESFGRRGLGIAGVICLLCLAGAIYTHSRLWRADAYVRKEILAWQKQDYSATITAGEAARRLNPFRVQIHEYLGDAYLLVKDVEKAHQSLTAYHAVLPNNLLTLRRLAVSHLWRHEYDEAEAVVLRGRTIAPKLPEFTNLLAHVYRNTERPEEALASFREASKMRTKDLQFQIDYGLQAYFNKDYPLALEIYLAVIATNPNHARAHYMAGSILFYHLNRRKAGGEHFLKALQLDPGIKEKDAIRRALAQLKTGVDDG
jgi:O-antigen ligase